ncbi:MAG: PD40 domain-containing protein, partial [Rubrivivax sp.]|nr:PD40 domain-containing protein [Rubrivivax sp.]
MAKKKPLDVETLWRIERLGAPSLCPDGAQAVAALTRHSMDDNSSRSTLWLLSTLGGAPRALTQCGDKDGQPQWSPRGDRIAFVAKREQQGHKDEQPQIYLIAPDGGEAERAATVATGAQALRWLPDGSGLLFISWVWPGLSGEKAQAKALAEQAGRKESGYATSQTQYRHWDQNLPAGREPMLHLLQPGQQGRPARVRNLMQGSGFSLQRHEPGTNSFDVSPDGRRVAFAFDPHADKRIENRHAIAELDLASGRFEVILRDADWHFGAPRYSP